MVLNYRMRFYLVLFFCGLGFLFSCTDEKSIPGDVLPEDQMVSVLTDVHLVDGNIYNLSPVPDTLAKHGLGLYLAVFKMHHTDTTQFKASVKYYTTRPDVMLKMYDKVLARLDSLQKAKAQPVKPAVVPKASDKNTKQLADSIKKAQAKTDSANKAKAKADSIKAKKKADSLRTAKFKLLSGKDIAQKVKRDSVKKVKHKHHPVVKPIQTPPNAVPPE